MLTIIQSMIVIVFLMVCYKNDHYGKNSCISVLVQNRHGRLLAPKTGFVFFMKYQTAKRLPHLNPVIKVSMRSDRIKRNTGPLVL